MAPEAATTVLIDSSALADWLEIAQDTPRDWRRSGTGPPYIRIGRQVRYSVAAVEEWLAAQTVVAAREPA